MKHRIFIAINLPAEIKAKIIAWQKKHWDLPMRWTKPESLHITLVFFGYVDEEELAQLQKISREAVSQFKPMEIEFERIAYGPDYDVRPVDLLILKRRAPRLIWLIGVYNEQLEMMQQKLASVLLRLGSRQFYERDHRHYKPHITLARTDQKRWQQAKNIPWIDEKLSLKFTMKSTEVMESRLRHSGAEYQVVESIRLGDRL